MEGKISVLFIAGLLIMNIAPLGPIAHGREEQISTSLDEYHELEMTVRESDQILIYEALVKLEDVETGDIESEYTDEDGIALFPELEEGEYEYTITHEEYKEKNDTVEVDQDSSIDVYLESRDHYTLEVEQRPFDREGVLEIKTDDDVEEYESDSVTLDYINGTEVKLTAIPDQGWNFYGWDGDVREEKQDQASINLTMDENKEVSLHFEEEILDHDLIFSVKDEDEQSVVSAEVSLEFEDTDHVEETDENGEIVFDDMTEGTYEYVVEHPDHVPEEGTINLEEDSRHEVQLEEAIWLQLEIEGQGTVYLEFDPGYIEREEKVPGERWEYKVEQGTEVELTAEVAGGWVFFEWDGVETELKRQNQTDFTMTEDKEVTAGFAQEDEIHTLEILATRQGTFKIDGEEHETLYEEEYLEGTEVELEAIADEDSYFVEWLVEVDEEEYETFDENRETNVIIDQDYYLVAGFMDFKVELSVEGEGKIIAESRDDEDEPWDEHDDSPIEDELLTHGNLGTHIRLTAEPAEGYGFVEWEGSRERDEVLTFQLGEDEDITAVFAAESDLTITVEDKEGEPIEGADVVINTYDRTTDEDGEVVFEDMTEDTYTYSVQKDGYIRAEGELTVEDDDIVETVTLEPRDDENEVDNGEDEENGIPGFGISAFLISLFIIVLWKKKRSVS